MKENNLISIITPSYNSSSFIGETIDSIIAQTYTNWELIVTDDYSSDNSCKIIEEYSKKDSRIKLIRLKENSGAGVARNTSIEAAKGKYLAFCDSDDRWYPEKLEKQLTFMKRNDLALCYSSYDVCDEKNHIKGFVKCLPFLNKRKILRDNGIGCLTAIYDQEKIGKHFMPTLRKRQDWCLWIDIISRYGPAKGIDEPLALYRDRDKSISSNKVEMLKYNYEVYHSFLKKTPLESWLRLIFDFLPYYFYKKFKQKRDFKKRIQNR